MSSNTRVAQLSTGSVSFSIRRVSGRPYIDHLGESLSKADTDKWGMSGEASIVVSIFGQRTARVSSYCFPLPRIVSSRIGHDAVMRVYTRELLVTHAKEPIDVQCGLAYGTPSKASTVATGIILRVLARFMPSDWI